MYNAWAEKIQSQEMGNRLIGYGSYLPERVVKNAEFERVMDTTDEWIVSRTGIKERHFARADETVVDMATIAAQRALDNAGLTIDDIDLREDNYRFAIPREKVSDEELHQLDSKSYLGRMRGKYLICDYTFDCNNNREFKLPYIKTTYRYSML